MISNTFRILGTYLKLNAALMSVCLNTSLLIKSKPGALFGSILVFISYAISFTHVRLMVILLLPSEIKYGHFSFG